MTTLARLRRRCETRIAGIELPRPFDIDAFCAQVAAQRDRPIRICALPSPARTGTPCGAWLQTATTDWVFVEHATSRFHRDHIVLHELAHMLCGHRRAGPLDDSLVATLAPDAIGAIRHMLGRTDYSSEAEQEAELMARLILARAHIDDADRRPPSPATAGIEPTRHATARRIEDILG